MTKRILAVVIGLSLAGPAVAMDHSKMKSGMDHGKMSGQGAMDHGEHKGEMIHMSKVGGYQFAYHLIDMKEKMEAMKGMKGMSAEGHDMSKMASHHLMLYIADSAGTNVTEGKVGYKVTDPDGTDQKAMAMAMAGAFGADVDFKTKGAYAIKTKAVVGEAQLLDEFTYEVH